MSFTVLCTVVFIFYAVLWFFDSFFKSCMHYPYYAFLKGTGLSVGLLNFSWTTTAFNRLIYKWSKNMGRLLRKWFSFGYIVTIWLFLPFALWTLFSLIYQHFNDTIPLGTPEVQAMLPGVNIPTSEFWYYFISIAISSVLHELGHAMAAVQEDVQVLAVGVYVFTIIPVAFVQLNTEHLNCLSINKRLRIYCAGVWHNIVISFIALLLFFSSPILFSFLYDSNIGVRVVDFTPDSPLKEVRGLEKGDVITTINGCDVQNMKDWNYCMHMAYNRYGICTISEFISLNDEGMKEFRKDNGVMECCRKEDIYSFCFEYMEPKNADSGYPEQYSCLRPRDMVANSYVRCTESTGYSCPRDNHCLKPSLNNQTYLIILERKEDTPVLYLGMPYDVYKTVMVDQYFAKVSFLSSFSPKQFERFLHYIFMFSLGIGFLNIIPCYGTDGHHIARDLIKLTARYLGKNDEFVTFFTIFTVFVGTGLTIPSLIYLFYKQVYLAD